jgi:hypothetical protein
MMKIMSIRKKAALAKSRERNFGVFTDQAIKKIGESYFFVKIFEKNDHGLRFLSFILKNAEPSKKNYKLNFNQDENRLINTEGMMLHTFILNKLNHDPVTDQVFIDIIPDANYIKLNENPPEKTSAIQKVGDAFNKEQKSALVNLLRDMPLDEKISVSRNRVDNKVMEFNLYYDKFGRPSEFEKKAN